MHTRIGFALVLALTSSPAFAGDIIPPPPGARVINFDDFEAPPFFILTTALTDRYSALGVNFSAENGSLDGGAVLNDSTGFGVTGYSVPNFLAFNTAIELSDGGLARGPERITFRRPVRHLQMNVGSEEGGMLAIQTFDSHGNGIGEHFLSLGAGMQTISVVEPDIKFVTFNTDSSFFVVDDLAFVLDSTRIDFEDLDPAPSLFSDTTALRDRYAALGAHFYGDDKNGGGILTKMYFSGFGGVGGNNLLGFFDASPTGDFSDGGHAVLPQTIFFDAPVASVELFAGSDQEVEIRMEAFDNLANVIDAASITASHTLQPLLVEAPGIRSVVLSSEAKPGAVTVVDNIRFDPEGTLIDFDDLLPAPESYADSEALRERYAPLGIHFDGEGQDGGGILAGASRAETGFSAPNVLAFAMGGAFSEDSHASFPETLTFDRPLRYLQLRTASMFEGQLNISSFDANGIPIANGSFDYDVSLATLTLDTVGAVRVEISSTISSAVIDDLTFISTDPCVHDVCVPGVALVDVCDVCSEVVCAADSFCCDTNWDIECVKQARELCASACPENCEHSVCTAGAALPQACTLCATLVCIQDSFCCTETWDTQCAREANQYCSAHCDVCGDANYDGKILASDALITLRAAVGTAECVPEICDYNGSGSVTASDALAVLKVAVGQSIVGNCPGV